MKSNTGGIGLVDALAVIILFAWLFSLFVRRRWLFIKAHYWIVIRLLLFLIFESLIYFSPSFKRSSSFPEFNLVVLGLALFIGIAKVAISTDRSPIFSLVRTLTLIAIYLLVFATAYHGVGTDAHPAFTVGGHLQNLTHVEGIYFTIVTATTTGYGDIVAATDQVRVVVSIQLVTGFAIFAGFVTVLITRISSGGRTNP